MKRHVLPKRDDVFAKGGVVLLKNRQNHDTLNVPCVNLIWLITL